MSEVGKRIPVVIGVCALVVLALLVWGVVSRLEQVERAVRTPPRGEARTNPLLAAERFLERLGLPTSSATTLDELPPVDHVLVLALENRVLTRARAERLLDWVERGGYLIVGPHLSNGEPTEETWSNDVLLDGLDVRVEAVDTDTAAGTREMYPVLVGDDPVEVRFFDGFGLANRDDDPGDPLSNIVHVERGEGRAVVLTDLRFLRNDEIGDLDHASFLWQLARFDGEPRGVLLVHGWGSESIWSMLFRHAWVAGLVGLLFATVWVWRRATSIGPPIPDGAPGSRSLIEHVDALGHFLWRAARQDTLVAGARRALRRRVVARRPDFAAMSRAGQVEALAVGSDLSPESIDAAFFGGTPRKRETFTRTIRTLEKLRREL